MANILLKILATLALVTFNAFFVAAEYAAITARATRLHLPSAETMSGRAARLIKTRLDLFLSSCQLGTSLSALGLGAIWKSAPVLHTAPVRELFGVGPDERLLGWVNLGTAGRGAREPDGRGAVDLGTLVTVLDGAGQHPLDGGEPPQ